MERLYTTQEAAEYLRLTVATVTAMARSGRLRGVKPTGHDSGGWRFSESELRRVAEGRPESQIIGA